MKAQGMLQAVVVGMARVSSRGEGNKMRHDIRVGDKYLYHGEEVILRVTHSGGAPLFNRTRKRKHDDGSMQSIKEKQVGSSYA